MKIRLVRDFATVPVSLRSALAHEACLQAHVRIAHLAVQFGLRHQRGDRVDHQHVNGSRTYQRFGDLQRLLAVVRLRDQQVVHVHAQLLRVARVQRMLGVHKGRQPAGLLRLGDDLQRNGRLARRFRPKDLDHTPARHTAHAQRRVKGDRSRGDDRNRHDRLFRPQPHDGSLAKLLFDLCQCQIHCFRTIRAIFHGISPLFSSVFPPLELGFLFAGCCQ